MQVSSSSVSRAAQPERRREGLKRAGNVPSFQQPVPRTRPRYHNADNNLPKPPILNIRLLEEDFEYIRGIDKGEAQFEADCAKNEEDYRDDIPLAVPYYGLERAVDLLESVDLADLGFNLFPSSDLIEIMKLLIKSSGESSIYDASVDKRDEALARQCVRNHRTLDHDIDTTLLSLTKPTYDHFQHLTNFPPPSYEYLVKTVATRRFGASRYFILSRFADLEDFENESCPAIEYLEGHSYMRYRKIERPEKHMTRQTIQHDNGVKEKSIQKVLQGMVSEVFHQSPPNCLELLDILINYSDLWSRRKVAVWKKSFGRSKEWRSCRFVKANKMNRIGKFFNKHDWMIKMNWRHSPPAVPINMLKRDTSFRLRFQTRPPRATASIFRYLVQEKLWDTYNSDIDDERIEHPSEDSKLPLSISVNPDLTQSAGVQATFVGLVLPYENFIGAILGGAFRILKFLRSENHGDVYAVEDLSFTSIRYEAKAYILRGVPRITRNYRVRNLKKLVSKPTFICSFDQLGKKFVVNRLEEKGEDGPTTWPRASNNMALKLGAVGRRNTPEFDKAFPKLATTSNNSTTESSIHIRTEDLLTAIQPYMYKQNPRFFVPMRRSEIMDLITQNHSPVVQKELPNGEDIPKMEISVSKDTTQKNDKKARRPKTTQKIERDRERHRLSRIRKRALKKAGLAIKDGDSPEEIEDSDSPEEADRYGMIAIWLCGLLTPAGDTEARSYRVIALPNKLEALLVHDPDTDKASASLNVNVGSFSDEDDMPGMAHAVEHALFMGTKKYPIENEYSSDLASHSGYSNAYTAATQTNYFFECAASNESNDKVANGTKETLNGAETSEAARGPF